MAVRNATPTNCPGFGALRDKCHNPADHGAAHDYCPSCLAKWEAHRDAIAAEVLSRHDDRAHPDTRAGDDVGVQPLEVHLAGKPLVEGIDHAIADLRCGAHDPRRGQSCGEREKDAGPEQPSSHVGSFPAHGRREGEPGGGRSASRPRGGLPGIQ